MPRRKNYKRRYKGSLRRLFWGWIAILCAGALIIYFKIRSDNQYEQCSSHDTYGIDLPTRYRIHGIDISRYQGTINWGAIKLMEDQGISLQFVFIKASQGIDGADPSFLQNWNDAATFRFARGAYHFFEPGQDPKRQAATFIRLADLKPGDLAPVLDVETDGGVPAAQLQQDIKVWLHIVQAHYGIKPIIYSNIHFYNKYLAQLGDDYPLWIAHYYQKERPRISRKWHFWQHSEKGYVDGVCGHVDFDVFYGSRAAFDSLRVP